MLVSFIIPYYNEDFQLLGECLDSILALSLRHDEREIIIVDDGSSKDISGFLSKYGSQVLYKRKPNGGLSSARNLGLELASGQYIQFVDADDHLIPSAYDRCLDVVRVDDPDVVMFGFSSKPVIKSGISSPVSPVDGAKFMSENNLRAAAWGYVFRRKILGDLRFSDGILHEDEEFTPILLLRCSRLFVMDDKAYFYRNREGSITRRKDLGWTTKRLHDQELIIMKFCFIIPSLSPEEKKALKRRTDQLTMDYLYNIIRLTGSFSSLKQRILRLEKIGQFPLPDNKYTRKYSMFRILINNGFGRAILFCAISLRRLL